MGRDNHPGDEFWFSHCGFAVSLLPIRHGPLQYRKADDKHSPRNVPDESCRSSTVAFEAT